MRIDCEVHAFRLKSRQAAPIIDGSMETLEGSARESKITGLVLVQPAFLNDDPAELFAQASQARMRVRLTPPLVQPQAPEMLEEWARLGAVGLTLTLTDPDPLAESIEAALQLGLHLEVSGGLEGREHLAERLLADGHPLVFRGFGLADSTRDPAWDPRLARLLALAKGAEMWVKLSGIGRVADSWAHAAAGRMLQELGPKQLLWGSQWPHVAAAHTPTRHPMRRHLSGLRSSSQTRTPRGRILGETPAALYRPSVS